MTDPRLENDDNMSSSPDNSSFTTGRMHGSHMQSQHPPPPRLSSPIVTNANRPPSSASVHSNTSSGAPRSTATSRRGGRTRSRSPPVVMSRPPLNNDERNSSGLLSDDYRSNGPPSPANPSTAAAKAAAAAKAFSNGSGATEPSSWYSSVPDGPDVDPRYHSEYDNSFLDSRSWPGEEPYSGRRQHQHIYRRGQQQHDPYSRRGPTDNYPPPQHYYEGGGDFAERRYREPRSHSPYNNGENQRRARPPDRRAPSNSHAGSHGVYGDQNVNHDYYNGPAGMAPATLGQEGRSSPKELSTSLKRVGGTSRVMGTPTPIHVPRAPDPPSHRHSRGGTPASVFRGRPADVASRGEEVDDDSPQKILLSLRTPTTSFEENPQAMKSMKSSGEATLPLSPEAPPQIHHSHHHSSSDQNLLFEPQRSPGGGALEIAPSFTLFNQSFDSLGDTAQYFNVGPIDSALQSTSFGAGPIASIDNDGGQVLNRNMSGGSYPQQLLAASGSGGLTFGMSPVNSFGNGAPQVSQRRNGGMMVLGGHDPRPPSPTQVLGIYRTHSGGMPYLSSRPSEEGHTRPGGGSFGGFSINQSYTRSFGVESSPIHYSRGQTGAPAVSEGVSAFYSFLRKYRGAFKECMFLLPGLKAALLESPLSSKDRSNHDAGKSEVKTNRGRSFTDPSPQDTAIAMRRVASAVCAFGGSINGDRARQYNQSAKSSSSQTIFSDKGDVESSAPSATVTPSSSTGTPPGSRFESRAKLKYDEQLPGRYYENENRLSWEFEESPPVENAGEDDGGASDRGDDGSKAGYSGKGGQGKSKKLKSDGDSQDKMSSSPEGGKKLTSPSPLGDQPKMRYRCKLCGQPKQNHTCPYQQSLQRSIGIMVYPAVNAYTAVEPGHLAPALSEMNNFINAGGDSVASGEDSPSRASPDRMRRITQPPQVTSGNQVTPETLRSTAQSNSPSSTLSTGSGTPQRYRTPGYSHRKARGQFPPNANLSGGQGNSGSRKKRSYAQFSGGPTEDPTDLLFMESIDLKPEQFRIVTPSNATCLPDAFTYSSLPLPYAQRKRLSDNLFALSKEVPQLTDECAVVLREAREKDLWDLAVAELMTQVVVIIHCPEGDGRFEGLRHYLLTIGIAC